MKTFFCTSLALALLIAAAHAAHAASAQQQTRPAPRPATATFDHERIAREWLSARGIDASAPSALDVGKLVDEHYASLVVGAIDLRYPVQLLGDKARADQMRDVAVALVELHTAFLDWAGARNDAEKALRKDYADLEKALAAARPLGLAPSDAPRVSAADVARALGLEPAAAEIALRAGERTRSGEAFGFHVARAMPTQLVCGPTRKDFVGFACALGWIDAHNRGAFWVDGVHNWTDLYWNDLQAIALAYPAAGGSPGDLSSSTPMDAREKTGLEQFVTQRAAHSLLWFFYGKDLDPMFESAVTLELVIACLGENNARTGFSSRGNQTQAMSVFVPGGAPEGGSLPPVNADSPWRAGLGADRFVKVLRAAQKAGAKSAGSKKPAVASFAIDPGATYVASAPFLGAAAAGREPAPREKLQDFMEFFRAYKTAFLHWLAEEGAGKAKESRAAWRALAAKVAGAGGKGDFETLAAEVYGVPLSSGDGAEETLEWRFLAWLSKQR